MKLAIDMTAPQPELTAKETLALLACNLTMLSDKTNNMLGEVAQYDARFRSSMSLVADDLASVQQSLRQAEGILANIKDITQQFASKINSA